MRCVRDCASPDCRNDPFAGPLPLSSSRRRPRSTRRSSGRPRPRGRAGAGWRGSGQRGGASEATGGPSGAHRPGRVRHARRDGRRPLPARPRSGHAKGRGHVGAGHPALAHRAQAIGPVLRTPALDRSPVPAGRHGPRRGVILAGGGAGHCPRVHYDFSTNRLSP